MNGTIDSGVPRHCSIHLISVLLLFCLVFLASFGAATAGWQVYLPSDGLLSEALRDADAGPSGEVWFLSISGVSRFDGLTWTNFTPDEIPGVTFLYRILADSQGRVWVTDQIDYTIAMYDGREWQRVEYWPDGYTWHMFEDSEGNIWFATADGILKYDGHTWTRYDESDGLISASARFLTQASDGSIWAAMGGGVSRFDGISWTNYTMDDGLGDYYNRVIIEDDQGRIWAGGYPLSRFDGETWVTFGEEEGVPFTYGPGGVGKDQQGNLWFSVSGRGVMRFDGTEWKVFRLGDDFHITWVSDVTVDTYNNVWIATMSGAVRFDGTDWRWLEPRPDSSSNQVKDIVEAAPGEYWLATDEGLYYSDHGEFTVHGILDSLYGDRPECLELLDNGELWVGGFYGIYIYDEETWTQLPYDHMVMDIHQHTSGDIYVALYDSCLIRISGVDTTVYKDDWRPGRTLQIAEDPAGALWVAAYSSGVGRLSDETWTWWAIDGGTLDRPMCIDAVENGDIWIGDLSGVSRFDGNTWIDYTGPEGVAAERVHSVYVDDRGYVWAGSESGSLNRFDGEHWTTFRSRDGLLPGDITTIGQDYGGRLLVGSDRGVSIGEMDRIPPQTFMDPVPPALSASQRQVMPLTVSHNETQGIRYSTSLDGQPWSPWSELETWIAEGLSDGVHELRARAKDRWGNVDPWPATATIEIDVTPPKPVIRFPAFGDAVRDTVLVTGTVGDLRFDSYRVLVRPEGTPGWDPPQSVVLYTSGQQPAGEVLVVWNTLTLDDGTYDMLVEVSDTLGLIGTDLVSVIVDNEAPWALETSPAVVKASAGGDVYTTGREVHLYFPPHCFETEAVVTVEPLSEGQVPDTLDSGARRLLSGYSLDWGQASLKKAATLDLAFEGSGADPDERPALYTRVDDGAWTRLGGTPGKGGNTISAPVTKPGWYALFAESSEILDGSGLAIRSITPRVFSPQGGFGDTEAAIGFTIGRSGPVTVKIYNRAGYLVRKVADNQVMGAGANLVRWDGRDHGGGVVPGGLYMVTVEALGTEKTKTLSVVR